MMADHLNAIKEAVIGGQHGEIRALVQLALEAGADPVMIVNDVLLPLVAESKSKVVALCMSDEGMPETADQRRHIADKIVSGLVLRGVALGDIDVAHPERGFRCGCRLGGIGQPPQQLPVRHPQAFGSELRLYLNVGKLENFHDSLRYGHERQAM